MYSAVMVNADEALATGLRPVTRRLRTLHHQVVDELGRRLVSGDVPEGTQLPPEAALAAEFGISKGGLREVIKALSAKGLVSARPRIGTTVNPRSLWNLLDPQVLDWHTQLSGAPLTEQLLELRLIVEPEAARLACERADDAALEQMVAAANRMRAAAALGNQGREEFVAADLVFHQTLLQASGNDLIAQLARLLSGAFRQGFDVTFDLEGSVARSLPLHASVARAMQKRDPAASATAARKLLLETTKALAAARAERRRSG